MKRSTFVLRLFGKIIALLLLSFAINMILNHFFEDTTLSILIEDSILRALPFICTVIFYDFYFKFKNCK